MTRRKKKNWSYNAGERGRNWVRAFRQARDGRYYLQWFDENHRKRSKLLKGVRTAREAKASADELAAVLAKASLGVPVHAEPQPTLAGMLDRYLKGGDTKKSSEDPTISGRRGADVGRVPGLPTRGVAAQFAVAG